VFAEKPELNRKAGPPVHDYLVDRSRRQSAQRNLADRRLFFPLFTPIGATLARSKIGDPRPNIGGGDIYKIT
jgi:hypothetical protein